MKIKLPILFLLIFSFAHAQVPSTWSSSSTYTSGALVLDNNGVTYIAQQDVSVAGTPLTDTSYWLSLDAAAPLLRHRLLLQLLPLIPRPFLARPLIQMILRMQRS